MDSATDSEFEDVCTAVIDNKYNAFPMVTAGNQNGDSVLNQTEVFEVFLEKQMGSFGLNVTVSISNFIKVFLLNIKPDKFCKVSIYSTVSV